MRFFANPLYILAALCCLTTSPAIAADNDAIDDKPILFGYSLQSRPTMGSTKYFESVGENASVQLRFIPAPSEDVAEAFIDDKLALFKSVYQGKRVDYPGQFSRVITCPDQFKPQFFPASSVADGGLAYYLGFSSKNKVPGACTPDLVAYRHFYGLLYCKKSSKVIEIEGFFNLNDGSVDKFIQEISCEM